jgi:hypothetical protein
VHGDPVEPVVAHHPRNLPPSACQSAWPCARRGGLVAGRRVARVRARAVSPGTRLLVAPQLASQLAVCHAEGREGGTRRVQLVREGGRDLDDRADDARAERAVHDVVGEALAEARALTRREVGERVEVRVEGVLAVE